MDTVLCYLLELFNVYFLLQIDIRNVKKVTEFLNNILDQAKIATGKVRLNCYRLILFQYWFIINSIKNFLVEI